MKRKIKTLNFNKERGLDIKKFKIHILGVVIFAMGVAAIFMTIASSTNGAEFARLQNEESELLSYQADLQQSLVKSLSVNSLQEKSMELGFGNTSNLIYLNDGISAVGLLPVAKLP